MKRRPKEPDIYKAVSDFSDKGSVKYTAHLVDRGGEAYVLGDETEGDSKSNPAGHPDCKFWQSNRNKIENALTKAKGSISRIEIDCTLTPCDGQFTGCLFTVPVLIRAHLHQLKNSVKQKGQPRFDLLDKINLDKIPLRIFSHRAEGTAPVVIFCLLGDGRQDLIKAFAAAEEWIWVEYSNKYLGPDITIDNRVFQVKPALKT